MPVSMPCIMSVALGTGFWIAMQQLGGWYLQVLHDKTMSAETFVGRGLLSLSFRSLGTPDEGLRYAV